jgi:hypothetical protein
MEYRATALKGTLTIKSRPGIGTSVICAMPWQKPLQVIRTQRRRLQYPMVVTLPRAQSTLMPNRATGARQNNQLFQIRVASRSDGFRERTDNNLTARRRHASGSGPARNTRLRHASRYA